MAKFIKGQSGNPNGRPKGSKNKKTTEFREQLAAALAEHDFCPITKLIDLAKHHPDPHIQLAATKELMSYYGAKLRAITITTEKQNPVSFVLNCGQ